MPPPSPAPRPPFSDETLRSTLRLARSLGFVIAFLAGLLFLLLLVVWFVGLLLGFYAAGLAGAVYCFLSAVVNYFLWEELPSLQRLVEERQYAVVQDRLVLWMVLGLLFFVVEGVVLVFAYLEAESLARSLSVPPAGPTPPPGAVG